MSTMRRMLQYGLLLFLLSAVVEAVKSKRAFSRLESVAQAKAISPVYQGNCGAFVSECYKTCFGLGQVRVSYACSLQSGVYSAHCGCGTTDETNIVLSKAGIPMTVTTTLQGTATKVAVLTATSTASTTTTTIATVQTSVCSYTTIASTILVTTTITAQPTTVTAFTTAISTSMIPAVGVYTSSVPAVVVSSGTTSQRKRAANAFCNGIQLACDVGCAAVGSTPSTQYCQAIMNSAQYSIACVCKNNVNVVQQVIQAFNLLRPAAQKCTSIATTKVAATATVTATSVSTIVVTSRVTVVPTTVVSVYTSVVSATSTYACYTTISTTTIATNVVTPNPTTTTVATTTVVTAAATKSFYVSLTVAGRVGPTYVAQSLNSHQEAQPVDDIGLAQVFVILQSTSSDSLYNLVGVGTGDYQGQSLGAYGYGDPDAINGFYIFFSPSTTLAQGPATISTNYFETAFWQIDLLSLVMQIQWTRPQGSSPSTTTLQGVIVGNYDNSLGAVQDITISDLDTPASYSLVPV